MPYLVLMKKDVKFSFRESEEGIVDIKLIFMNKGNGTATNVMCKCISDEMHKNTNLVAITYTYDYYVSIPFDWYSDVAMVNDLLSIQLMFEPSRVKFETNEMITSDQFDFDVLFRDIQGRNYKQKFSIQFHLEDGEYKVLLTNTYDPEMYDD